MITERYNRLSDLPESLPVFPLRGCILLPRTTLPLNIFEPRYLAMVEDILGGERLIGLVQPAPASPGQKESEADEDASPEGKDWPLRRAGCIGRITSFSEQDDGRLSIALTGISRFHIIDEPPGSKPYRICTISAREFESDLLDDHGEDQVDREKLLSLLRIYLDANDMSADWKSIHRSSTEYLVNTLCIHSPYGPEEKQALLESPDLRTRAETLMALAEMELAARVEGSGGGTLQ